MSPSPVSRAFAPQAYAPPPAVAPAAGPEPELDRLARVAAAVLRAPMAFFCVASDERMTIHGAAGADATLPRDVPITESVCRYVIRGGVPFVVDDVRAAPHRDTLPELVAAGMSAYLGVPVAGADGATIGSLCVVDARPRQWTDHDVAMLREAAASIMTALALRTELAARQAAEARATAAEARLVGTIERLGDAFVAVDRTWRFTYVNAAAERLLDRSRDALLGADALEAFPALEASIADAYRGAMASGEPRVCVAMDPLGTGHYEVRIHPGPDGLSIQFRDVTAQLRTEAALRSSEERFRALVEQGAEIVSVIDAAGVLRYVTPSAERALGAAPDALTGQDAFALVDPEDAPGLRAQLAALLADPSRVEPLSYRSLHASGARRVFEGTARNLLDVPGVRGIVVNVTDVTERRTLELQLRQAQKLEAIGLLAGGIAHDFNNLLTVIRGNLDFLRDAVTPHSQAADDLAEAEKATGRATTLVRQLLAFGQRQLRQPTVIDVNAVVADGERLVRRVVGDRVAVETELAAGLWAVRADRAQIEQVLMNLAVNGRDAMGDRPNGVLAVATANVVATPALAAQWGLPAAGDYVCLTVRDTGTGMDDETKARLFEPFFTTKPVGRGTGLGLAVVYGIVAQSGGAVHVESSLGTGSRFSVFLPRVDAPVEGAVYAPPSVARGTGTILLVEDEPAVRRATRRTLERAGYRVFEAQHGDDALLVWRELGAAAIDAVVTDARMPGIDGVDLVARLRAYREDLPVLLVSGYAADTLRSRRAILDRGPTRFLEKPFEAAELLETIRDLLL